MSVPSASFIRLRLLALIPLLLGLGLGLGGCINDSTTNPPVFDSTPDNDDDQGGVPPTEPPPTEPPPSGPTSGLKLIGSGADHNCAVRHSDASLWCWGKNDHGQLGNNAINDSSTFNRIDTEAWSLVAAGGAHSCAIQEDDTLWCWGSNVSGQVGINSATDAPVDEPARVGAAADWLDVALGRDHSCALRQVPVPDSEPVSYTYPLYCWGDNSQSQLGEATTDADGNPTDNSLVPLQVGSATDWRSVSLGDQASCAIKQDGSLWCWGDNSGGKLGLDPTAPDDVIETPRQTGLGLSWESVALGRTHGCAIDDTQALYCWGDNTYGQLGQNDTNDSVTPVQVQPGTQWLAVAAGDGHSCAVRDDATLWCWGNNGVGQLGVGTTSHLASPTQVGTATNWLTVSAGEHHSCAIDTDFIGHCWGLNDAGQLARGNLLGTSVARRFDSSDNWQALDSGTLHSCGLKVVAGAGDLKSLWCGGGNNFGQLGIGSTANQAAPVQIKGPSGSFDYWDSFATGHHYSCAIRNDTSSGTHPLYCWGRNDQGQLGRGNNSTGAANWSLQSKVAQGADDWTRVAAGAAHSCAIKGADGELWCWGDNRAGQLGDGGVTDSVIPVQVVEDLGAPAAFGAIDVAVGGYYLDATQTAGGHSCAIRAAAPGGTQGTLWCWGENGAGQLGDATIADPTRPHQITLDVTSPDISVPPGFNESWIAVAAGNEYTCGLNQAIRDEVTLYCWGDNSVGQAGIGDSISPVVEPTQVAPGTFWQDIGLGQQSACAVTSDNRLRCWGDNNQLQLTSNVTQPQLDDNNHAFAPANASFATDWRAATLGKTHGCGIREDSVGNRTAWCWGEGAEYQLGDGNAWKTTPQRLSLE